MSVARLAVEGGHNRGLIVGIVGIGVLFVATMLGYRLPQPAEDAAPDAFSAYRAHAQLASLVGRGLAHPIGSAANTQVRETIVRRLAELGYDTEIQSGFVCSETAVCAVPTNILARRHADGPRSGDAVVLSAHYDSVPAGPGASDDGAGVATLLEIARVLRSMPPTLHPIVLLFSDGEEAGLLGARLFVRDFTEVISAAVNVEARGTSGPSLMFETGSANSWLMDLFRAAIARPIADSLFYVAYKNLHNDTDFSIFKSVGWQGFNFAYVDDIALYHTPLDTLANADLRSIQHQGDNALATLLALANSEAVRSPPPGEAVYFDALARTVIQWPSRASSAAALAILAALSLEIGLLLRGGYVTVRQIAWGALGTFACLAIAAATSASILALLLEMGTVPPLTRYSWIAHPNCMNVVCVALAAGAAALAGVWLSPRARFWGFWAGSQSLLALGALLQAVLSPGSCFLSLVPAGASVVAVLPQLLRFSAGKPPADQLSAGGPAFAWRKDMAVLAPAWVMFALSIPPVTMLYGTVGSIGWPLNTVLLSAIAALLLPLLATAGGRLLRRTVALSVTLSVLGVSVTILLPTYSQAWPERLNFAYQVNYDEHQAFWVAQPDSTKLSAAIASVAAFDAEPKPLPWTRRQRGFYAPAAYEDLSPPQLTLHSVTPLQEGITRYDLQLRSMRAAQEIDVSFPRVHGIREIVVPDAAKERHWPLLATSGGDTRLHVVGVGPEGLNFTVYAHGASLEARLFDRSYSLTGGQFLQRMRSDSATSSQEGDTTVVRHTVTLDPAAGR